MFYSFFKPDSANVTSDISVCLFDFLFQIDLFWKNFILIRKSDKMGLKLVHFEACDLGMKITLKYHALLHAVRLLGE